jgi:hypothetical protein
MKSSRSLAFFTVFVLGSFLVDSPPCALAAQVTSPREQFGFNIGDDYCLANYKQLETYWHRLDKESDRVKVEPIGLTEEGRVIWMAIISSPANHKKLARWREIATKLTLAEGITETEARKLSEEGKAVVWIDGGLHATEVLGAQQLIETVYQLANGKDAETQRFLNDCVTLCVLVNPDGMDLVSDWYMREADPKKRSAAGLPRLYQKYIGHDNNRDFYALTQSESKAINQVLYREWHPNILYNHHQSGPQGTVLFCPPFRDPFNYNVDPLVTSGIDAVGASMMQRFLVEGKRGATVRSGSRYSTWWNGGLRTTCYFHNMIGLLTETIGSPTPMFIPFLVDKQLPRGDYLAPIAPQAWHFRQSIDYSVTANKAVLDYASKHRSELLFNKYLAGRNAIQRGKSDSWTITPKRVEAAQKARKGTPFARASATNEFARLFQKPEQRDPRGYIIPSDQPDFLTATKFVNILIQNGVKVQQATADFEAVKQKYPAGSYIVPCAQAFRAHVLDMFEPQDHPNDFPYPGAAPTPPYDIAGWTLALQMGIRFDRILDEFTGPFAAVDEVTLPPPGEVAGQSGALGFFLDGRVNDSFRAVNRLLTAGLEVRRLKTSFAGSGYNYPAGTFYVQRDIGSIPKLEKIAGELGVQFIGSPASPYNQSERVKPVRVGLWDRYGGSMPSGWTRWLFEKFEMPFQVVFPPELNAGKLREKFDVLVFVDGAIPARGTGASTNQTATTAPSEPSDAPAPERLDASTEQNLPADLRARRGSISASSTIPKLREFLEQGGTVLTIGSSTSLAQHLGLPVSSHLVETNKDGKESALSSEKFYVPGSLLEVKLDTSHPLTYGMEGEIDVMFVRSPVFKLGEGAAEQGVQRVGWYEGKESLRSGWAWGQERLDGGAAIVEARVGQGHLILFGPEIAFRAQPHGTFKLLFNGILGAGMVGEKIPLRAAGR